MSTAVGTRVAGPGFPRAAACAGVLLGPVAVPLGALVAAAGRTDYDPVRQSLSTLSRTGATDRWIMTAVLLVVGACYVVAALALRGAAVPGRVALGLGGAGTFLTGLLPQPFVGSSVWHMAVATLAWVALTTYPLAACPRPPVPGVPGRRSAWAATVVLLVLVVWFVVKLRTGGAHLGLSERSLVVAQTVWPALVVGATLRRNPQAAARP